MLPEIDACELAEATRARLTEHDYTKARATSTHTEIMEFARIAATDGLPPDLANYGLCRTAGARHVDLCEVVTIFGQAFLWVYLTASIELIPHQMTLALLRQLGNLPERAQDHWVRCRDAAASLSAAERRTPAVLEALAVLGVGWPGPARDLAVAARACCS